MIELDESEDEMCKEREKNNESKSVNTTIVDTTIWIL